MPLSYGIAKEREGRQDTGLPLREDKPARDITDKIKMNYG